jgi:putative transposase
VGLGRHAGARPSRALPHGSGSGRARALAQRWGDRQPERERRGKRGARIDPPGYDAGKKVKGKKRHLLVDTLGLILAVVVHPAGLQDRDGALLVLDRHTRRLFPFLETIFADGAYGGAKLRRAMDDAAWRIEVVKRSAQAKGFEVIPRRWVVERTIAWINRCRRLAKDYENLNRTAIAFIRLASIRLMLRRLTRYCYSS